MNKLRTQRDLNNLLTRNINSLRVGIQEWMSFVATRIKRDLTSKFLKDTTSELTNWIVIESKGKRILKPIVLKVLVSGGDKAYDLFKITGGFDALSIRAIKAADKICAKLVVEVTKETKKGIRTIISRGVKEGKSMDKIARELRPIVGLTSKQAESIVNYKVWLREKRPELSVADVDKRANTYAGRTHRRRAMTIARTETAKAQNVGYVLGLEDANISEVELLVAVGACDICAALNGKKYNLRTGQDAIPIHPNCHCAMLPVIGE